jgi:hypothetical protein
MVVETYRTLVPWVGDVLTQIMVTSMYPVDVRHRNDTFRRRIVRSAAPSSIRLKLLAQATDVSHPGMLHEHEQSRRCVPVLKIGGSRSQGVSADKSALLISWITST